MVVEQRLLSTRVEGSLYRFNTRRTASDLRIHEIGYAVR
jgi:hypothetical protein